MVDTSRIFEIKSDREFDSLALEIFEYQYHNTDVYREFCDRIGVGPKVVSHLEEIPFLPIELFKTKEIITAGKTAEFCFRSSGTTGSEVSAHYVADLELYRISFRKAFKKFYGDIRQYCVLGLLPSYLERKDSSLVFMVEDFIRQSEHPESGFYLHDYKNLSSQLQKLEEANTPVLLIGVTFALLDMIESCQFSLKNTIVMETGGMKGRRMELIREEVHSTLKEAWGLAEIHSEYGMTELLSQAYSKGSGEFNSPEWMRIMIRDTEDPRKILQEGLTGGINIIDLANIYSCSFIASQDLGKLLPDGRFEVLGRFDHSDIRGCNLMAI